MSISTIEDLIIHVQNRIWTNPWQNIQSVNDFDSTLISSLYTRVSKNTALTTKQASAFINIVSKNLFKMVEASCLVEVRDLLANPQYKITPVVSRPSYREVRSAGLGVLVFQFPNNPSILENLKEAACPDEVYQSKGSFYAKVKFLHAVRVDSKNAENILEFIKRHKFSCDEEAMRAIAEAIDNKGTNSFLVRSGDNLEIQNSGNIVLDSLIYQFLINEMIDGRNFKVTPSLIRKFSRLHELDTDIGIDKIFPENVTRIDEEILKSIPEKFADLDDVKETLDNVQYLLDYDYRCSVLIKGNPNDTIGSSTVSNKTLLTMMIAASVNKSRPILVNFASRSFSDAYAIKNYIGKWFPEETCGDSNCDWIIQHNHDSNCKLKISPTDVKQVFTVVNVKPDSSDNYVLNRKLSKIEHRSFIQNVHDSIMFFDVTGFDAIESSELLQNMISILLYEARNSYGGFWSSYLCNYSLSRSSAFDPNYFYYSAYMKTPYALLCCNAGGFCVNDLLRSGFHKFYFMSNYKVGEYCGLDDHMEVKNQIAFESFILAKNRFLFESVQYLNFKNDHNCDIIFVSKTNSVKKTYDALSNQFNKANTGAKFLSVSHDDLIGFIPERKTLVVFADCNFSEECSENYLNMIHTPYCFFAIMNAFSKEEIENATKLVSSF